MIARFAGVLCVVFLGFGLGPPPDSIQSFQEALNVNRKDSLAHFRLGERHLRQHDLQAANEFHGALDGEPHPKWIDAWAHFDLEEIFDVTNQRDRAVREYYLAAQTGDNTEDLQALISERSHRAPLQMISRGRTFSFDM